MPKKRFRWLKLVLIVALAGICLVPAVPAGAQQPEGNQPEIVPGEILVKFKPSLAGLLAEDVLEQRGWQVLSISVASGLQRVAVGTGEEEQAVATLNALQGVELASVNHVLEATLVPNDPYYAGYQWNMPKIDAPEAWDHTTGSASVIVAIVDSGLDTANPEFSGRIVYPHDEIDNDTVPQDTCTHGTHVTGIAAAQGNNGIGIAGMAWNVKIMPVRVLTQTPSTCSGSEADIHDGIYWAVNHGAQVINLSLGGSRLAGDTCEQDYPILSSAVQYAHDSGVLVVAASGNTYSNQLSCPAYQTAAMAVGATTSTDTRASYSNYGEGLSVVAPGDYIYSTLPGSTYGYKSGTSMAAPHVTGLAALLLSISPSSTAGEIQTTIESTADDLGPSGWDEQYGYGRINAFRAVDALYSLSLTPDELRFLISDVEGPLPVSGNLTISTDVQQTITWTVVTSPTVSWVNFLSSNTGTVSAGSPAAVTLTVSRPVTYGSYTATLVVTATGAGGAQPSPQTSLVRVSYLPELLKTYMGPIWKN